MSMCIFLAEQQVRKGPRIDKYPELISKIGNDMGCSLKLESVVGMSDPTISPISVLRRSSIHESTN